MPGVAAKIVRCGVGRVAEPYLMEALALGRKVQQMPAPKFYVPHPFRSRGCGVVMDPKTPDIGQVYFDVDGSARYLFSMSRRELTRLARAIDRKLGQVPHASRGGARA